MRKAKEEPSENKIKIHTESNLSEIVITAMLPYLEKIKKIGVKKSISNLLPEIDLDSFVLKKIKNQLSRRRTVELGKGLGRVDVQYRRDGIQIEPMGILRFLIKKITITDEQIIDSFDSILNQIEKNYIEDTRYITEKTRDIIAKISSTEIYKPKTSEEKTLRDLTLLILLNYYQKTNEIPQWTNSALENLGDGKFIKEWLNLLTEYVLTIIAKMSDDIFLDYKVTFDSKLLRIFLNKKTNRGQISKLFKMFNIDLAKIVYNFSKDYVSPSFIKGVSEILCQIASTLLSDFNKKFGVKIVENFKEAYPKPFAITMTFGKDVFSERAFRWYTLDTIKEGYIEYATTPDFSDSVKIQAKCEKVPRAKPVLNLGLITSYEIISLSKYSVQLSNLIPNTTYYYRIICGENCKSDIYTFEIPKLDNEFKFTVFADSQGMVKYDYDVFLKVFKKALESKSKTNFIVHLGDFVDDGNNEEYWNWLLDSKLWGENVTVPLAGNHEVRTNALVSRSGVENSIPGHFNIQNLPPQDVSTGIYYSFVYNNATFIVLNTNSKGGEKGLDKEQYKWALKTAKESKTKWKVLFTHKTPYSNGPHYKDADVRAIGRQIINLAYEAGIDLVFGGHDHVYTRTPVLALGEKLHINKEEIAHEGVKYGAFVNPNGTIFVIPGTSGVKNYKQNLSVNVPSESMVKLKLPVYSEVEVTEDCLFFKAYSFDTANENSRIIDSFAIRKPEQDTNKIDSNQVENLINSIPDCPWVLHTDKINEIMKMYESLEYSEKINVKNYSDFCEISRKNQSYQNILSGEIAVVKNKREFISALENPNIATIITDCSEIKLGKTFNLERDICIRGSAKLMHVRFMVKNSSMLILADSICIDNVRKTSSLFPSTTAVRLYENSTLILNDNASINCGYGIGLKGQGVYMPASGSSVYLNSASQSFASKGFIFAPNPDTKVIMSSGKYCSLGGNFTINVNGTFKMNGGFVRNIKLAEDAKTVINGGVIGEDNKLQYPVPVECMGNLKVNAGKINARGGISLYSHGDNAKINIETAVDIRGKILYN